MIIFLMPISSDELCFLISSISCLTGSVRGENLSRFWYRPALTGVVCLFRSYYFMASAFLLSTGPLLGLAKSMLAAYSPGCPLIVSFPFLLLFEAVCLCFCWDHRLSAIRPVSWEWQEADAPLRAEFFLMVFFIWTYCLFLHEKYVVLSVLTFVPTLTLLSSSLGSATFILAYSSSSFNKRSFSSTIRSMIWIFE